MTPVFSVLLMIAICSPAVAQGPLVSGEPAIQRAQIAQVVRQAPSQAAPPSASATQKPETRHQMTPSAASTGDSSPLTALLRTQTEAIKKLTQKVDELEKRINSLENK